MFHQLIISRVNSFRLSNVNKLIKISCAISNSPINMLIDSLSIINKIDKTLLVNTHDFPKK